MSSRTSFKISKVINKRADEMVIRQPKKYNLLYPFRRKLKTTNVGTSGILKNKLKNSLKEIP